MSKTFWLDNPWIYLEKLINKIREFFKPEPSDTIWLDNPLVYFDTMIKKIQRFLNQD